MREIEIIGFREALKKRQEKINSCLCVGIDPLIEKMPDIFPRDVDDKTLANNIIKWMNDIVDSTAEHTTMYKVQRAYFEAFRFGEEAMREIINYIHINHPEIPVFVDCKRGDIDRTQARYSKAHFILDQADGINYNPYMGDETITGLLEYTPKWASIVVLGRTSNKTAKNVQDLLLKNDLKLWEQIVDYNFKLAIENNVDKNFGIVMGSAYMENNIIHDEHLRKCREIVGDKAWFLIPGIGTQGGLLKETIMSAWSGFGSLAISSSSQIIFANNTKDFAMYSKLEAEKLHNEFKSFSL